MFNECWERANFVIFSKKQTVVTRALNSLQDPTELDIVVVYGDGSFASGGRDQCSVPVKLFKDVLVPVHPNCPLVNGARHWWTEQSSRD
jgi:hypothetical protein